jgi:AraC-like DNA-binding protein
VTLTASLAHESAVARIRIVHCRPEDRCCGPIEHATTSTLVLPLRGVFVKHRDPRTHLVADICHGVFFNVDEPYRVSHPVDGGDECLAIEPTSDVLREIAGPQGEAARDKATFAGSDVLLTAESIVARKSLRHRLARRLANRLEADETALQLLAATTRSARTDPLRALHAREQTRYRHEEIVEHTKITLVSEPAQDWTLSALAKRVSSSPFHLARMFRRYAGLPLHRYQMMARLTAALDDVIDTSRDLATVGVDLGFSSHSHFTAAFRNIFGTTPSLLRRSANQRDATEMRKILTARKRPFS